MGNFSGFNQGTERQIVSSLGNELAVDGAGLIGVNTLPDITIAAGQSVEITNDVGNPIPISGNISAAPPTLVPLGYERLTVGNTAVGLTVPALSEVALIQNETTGGSSGVRWRDDGTSPTSSVGMLLAGGSQFEYAGDLNAIEFINRGGGSDTLNISYYRYT